jgi:hypothetical protein
MDALISYFSDLEKRPLERAGFFIAGMVFLWLIENAVPLLQTHYKKSKGRHAATNIAFTAIHFIIHTLLAGELYSLPVGRASTSLDWSTGSISAPWR